MAPLLADSLQLDPEIADYVRRLREPRLPPTLVPPSAETQALPLRVETPPATEQAPREHSEPTADAIPPAPQPKPDRPPQYGFSAEDLYRLTEAQKADRETARVGRLDRNLSRSAAMYRGEKVGAPDVEVPSEVKDFMQRRQMFAPILDPVKRAQLDHLAATTDLARARQAALGRVPGEKPLNPFQGRLKRARFDNGAEVWFDPATRAVFRVTAEGGIGSQINKPMLPGDQIAPPSGAPPTSPARPPSAAGTVSPEPSGPGKPATSTHRGGGFFPLVNKELDKASREFGKDIDPNSSTAGAQVTQNMGRLNAAVRLRALVTNPDGSIKDNIPPQFMKEVAAALASLVASGGHPAEALIESLTAHSASSKAADWVQWLTSHPQDAGQQGFVKLYLESAEREEKVAEDAVRNAIKGRFGKHQRIIRGNPEVARGVARQYGWEIDENGDPSPVGSLTGEEKKAKPAEASGGPRTATYRGQQITNFQGMNEAQALAEARKLPKGALFVDPSGNVRTR